MTPLFPKFYSLWMQPCICFFFFFFFCSPRELGDTRPSFSMTRVMSSNKILGLLPLEAYLKLEQTDSEF